MYGVYKSVVVWYSSHYQRRKEHTMGAITLTIETDDFNHDDLLDNLRVARDGREGLTLRTGGGEDFVEILAVRDGGTS